MKLEWTVHKDKGLRQDEEGFVYDGKMTELETDFFHQVQRKGLPLPEFNVRFHHKRQWKFDFAWNNRKIAVEIEGGTWTGGRHTTGDGFRKDCEKYNEAALLGWLVLRFTTDQVRSGYAIETTRRALEGKEE